MDQKKPSHRNEIWAYRYTPTSFQDTIFQTVLHTSLSQKLLRLVPCRSALLLHGPSGSGKATFIRCMLRERGVCPGSVRADTATCYGRDEIKRNNKGLIYKTYPEHSVTFSYSDQHAELECYSAASGSKAFRAWVRTQVIKSQKLGHFSDQTYMVVLFHVDSLSSDDQIYLAQAIQHHQTHIQWWLSAVSISGMQKSLLSRVLPVRVPAPTADELTRLVVHVLNDQKIVMPASEVARSVQLVVTKSRMQLDTALHLLQGSIMVGLPDSYLPWQRHLIVLGEMFQNVGNYATSLWLQQLNQWAQVWYDHYYHYTTSAYAFLANHAATHSGLELSGILSDIISSSANYQLHTQYTWPQFQVAFECCCIYVAEQCRRKLNHEKVISS